MSAIDCSEIIRYDNVVSTRFFWWPARNLTFRWKPIYLYRLRGGDGNCNRSIGVRVPGGVLFFCLNVPLRQRPCGDCLREWVT